MTSFPSRFRVRPTSDLGPKRTFLRSTLATVFAVWLLQACTVERVAEVDISTVTVSPPTVSVVAGADIQLSATVHGERGALPGARPTWSSNAPGVATVDSTGSVRAYAEGSVTVTATFRGTEGRATVNVLPGPTLEVSSDSITMSAEERGDDPPPQTLYVSNRGTGVVTDLATEIRYAGDGAGWLAAEFTQTTAPANLTITADIDAIEYGQYLATVIVSSSIPGVRPVEITVTLDLARYSCTRPVWWLPCR